MKKLIALLLALAMVVCLFVGCADSNDGDTQGNNDIQNSENSENNENSDDNNDDNNDDDNGSAVITNADEISDTMTSENGKYEIAFITDVGQLKDKSFNQGTFDGVKLYAANNNKSYKYYQPANGDQATDDDRYDAMKAAVENGAEVVVCAGYMQGAAIAKAAEEFTDVKFIFIDGWAVETAEGVVLDNVAGVVFHEEQCGYLAGYAAVKEGYTKLGFCGGGGGDNDAVNRYGWGYVQGADAAAKELNINVELNYTFLYGASFTPSPELQALCSGWYENGTEVIFSCGGSIFDSVTAAASANDAAVIGVDVDQSFTSDTVITSALKGIGEAAQLVLAAAYGNDWTNYAGACINLGAAEGAVGLPTATWSLANWSVEDYQTMFDSIVNGDIQIDADFNNLAGTDNVTLNIVD